MLRLLTAASPSAFGFLPLLFFFSACASAAGGGGAMKWAELEEEGEVAVESALLSQVDEDVEASMQLL